MRIMMIFAFFALIPLNLNAQGTAPYVEPDEVFVKSWERRNENIEPRVFNVALTKSNPDFETEIVAMSGKTYSLSFQRNYAVDIKGEHWKAVMTENNREGKTSCLDLLYGSRPCETGRHYFPRERLAAYFYPYIGKRITVNNGNSPPLIEYEAYYSTSTVRRFLVHGIEIIIRNTALQFDENDLTRVKLLKFIVEIRNVESKRCKQQAEEPT